MKKVLFAVALMLLLASTGRSQTVPHYIYIPQYIHVPSGPAKPWEGHSLLSLYAGTGSFSRPDDGPYHVSDYSPRTPFAIGIRYAGEKDFAKVFFWGWYGGMDYHRFGYNFTYDGQYPTFSFPDHTTSAGHDVLTDRTAWDFSVEEGIVIGGNISRSLSLNLSAGLFIDLLGGETTRRTFVNRTTGLVTYEYENRELASSLFSFIGFSLRTELRYFFSGPCFVSLAASTRLSIRSHSFEEVLGVNHYSLLLGVGYKAFNKKSSLTDD